MRSVTCPSSPGAGTYSFNWSNIGQQTADGNDRQNEWVSITAPHHPLLGQLVRVVRRLRRDDGIELVIEGTEGNRQLIPLAWTEVVRPETPAVPSLRFTPGSLRAVVRLVRAYRSQSPAEVRYADRPDPDTVDHVPGGDPRSDDRLMDRSAASPAAGPDRPGGDAS
jgi:hypothetical protein